MIRTTFVLTALLVFVTILSFAQSERKAVRQGNREFKKGEFLDSEISYRSAVELNPSTFKGNFNLGSALYKQEKFEETANLYADMASLNADANNLAKVYHNLGNSLFKQEKFEESVEASKNALRNNPDDMETKYNLAQAQRMLAQQQQQQQQDQNQDEQDKDQDQDQHNQDQNQDQDKKDQEQDQQNQDQKEQNQQQREQKISPEDARRMLEAIQNNEKQVQERVKEEKAQKAKVQVEKNW